MRKTESLGYYGNIWIRQNVLEKAGEFYHGHTHDFDHISLLSCGKVLIEIEGKPPKEFTAPTFIIIRRDLEHKFTALADNSVWFCIHALRDIDGEVIEDLYSHEHDPCDYNWNKMPLEDIENLKKIIKGESQEDYIKRMEELDRKTTHIKESAKKWNIARDEKIAKQNEK